MFLLLLAVKVVANLILLRKGVGNIPTNTTQHALNHIFSKYGMIESTRVLSHKNCGFINFYTQEEAVRARKQLQNQEIMGPGTGSVRIGFAKVPPATITANAATKLQLSPMKTTTSLDMMEENMKSTTPIPSNYLSEEHHLLLLGNHHHHNNNAVVTERKLIMQEFGQDDSDGPMFDGKT